MNKAKYPQHTSKSNNNSQQHYAYQESDHADHEDDELDLNKVSNQELKDKIRKMRERIRLAQESDNEEEQSEHEHEEEGESEEEEK